MIGLRKLVREGIDGYLGSGKARCKLTSPSPVFGLGPTFDQNERPFAFGHCAAEGWGEWLRGGKEREKQRAREEKNDLANFFYRVQGQWDNQTARLKRHPPHLSSIHSPFKGIKGIYIYIYTSNHYLGEIVRQTYLIRCSNSFSLLSSYLSSNVLRSFFPTNDSNRFLLFFASSVSFDYSFGAKYLVNLPKYESTNPLLLPSLSNEKVGNIILYTFGLAASSAFHFYPSWLRFYVGGISSYRYVIA